MKYILDLHTHTISSGHAYSTLKENIDAAITAGIEYLGMSDHAPSMPGTCHIFHFHNMRAIPEIINNINILKGVELNIIDYDGGLDISNDDLSMFDYTIASFHPPCLEPSTKEINTNGLIKIMENPKINIIGHPDDSRFPLDYEQIVLAAKKNNVLLELNNASLNPNGFRLNTYANSKYILELCKKHDSSIILGSDAHISTSIGDFSNCLKLIKETNFPDKLIVNTSYKKLLKFLNK